MNAELDEAIATLQAAGYLVAKIPTCTKTFGHGAHVLITRSASCKGVEPIPHGYHSSHFGTFGQWVNCRCGRSFSDFAANIPTQWEEHKAAHGVEQ